MDAKTIAKKIEAAFEATHEGLKKGGQASPYLVIVINPDNFSVFMHNMESKQNLQMITEAFLYTVQGQLLDLLAQRTGRN